MLKKRVLLSLRRGVARRLPVRIVVILFSINHQTTPSLHLLERSTVDRRVHRNFITIVPSPLERHLTRPRAKDRSVQRSLRPRIPSTHTRVPNARWHRSVHERWTRDIAPRVVSHSEGSVGTMERVVKWKGGRDERMTCTTRSSTISGIPTTSSAWYGVGDIMMRTIILLEGGLGGMVTCPCYSSEKPRVNNSVRSQWNPSWFSSLSTGQRSNYQIGSADTYGHVQQNLH
jgi:hypothetical protein